MLVYVCLYSICVYFIKGCVTPVELSVIEEVLDPVRGGKVGILVLLCVYI